jgi:hypothetical protein
VLLLALQTDVIGVHWLAFTVWAVTGLVLGLPRRALVDDAEGSELGQAHEQTFDGRS